MLNVYFTIQRMNRGLPQGSNVKMFKHRKLSTRTEAFSDILMQLGDYIGFNPDSVFAPFQMELSTLMGQAAAEGSSGAACLIKDTILIVSYLEGEACEVGGRGY